MESHEFLFHSDNIFLMAGDYNSKIQFFLSKSTI